MFYKILILNFIFCSQCICQDTRFDGNWWNGLEKFGKTAFVSGFFSGMELGKSFSYWSYIYTDEKCSDKVVESYHNYWNEYVAYTTPLQVVDGLDEFYKDYRNRKILIEDAIWLILNEIKGKPPKELEEMIGNFRKNATNK